MISENLKLETVRTRYAPSPTGYLHIGGTRTALFNYLFSKKNKGKFVLRIEDTDKERSKPEFEKNILQGLKWLGIKWDEGPVPILNYNFGEPIKHKYIGEYGPYRQSERLEIYARYLKKLLEEGKAYHCFCSKEELEAQRQYQMSIGQPPHYNGKCRNLPESKVKRYLAEGRPSIIRFKMPAKKIVFNDLIRGRVEFDSSLFGDIAISKDLASPLYNFAVAVDDFEMKITHIIRGEDHLSNTPKQILIQEALGFPQPVYAHLPLILGPDRTKLSKRHGATAITDYKKEGFLPEALVNFMSLLGWNPDEDREIFSIASLSKEFSLEKIQKGGAVFNAKKLIWINGFYIRQKSLDKLTKLCLPYLIKDNLIVPVSQPLKIPNPPGLKFVPIYLIKETGEEIDFNFIKKMISIYQKRLKKLSEITKLIDFFFKDKLEYDKNLLKWKDMNDNELRDSLDKLIKVLSKIKSDNWSKENIEAILMPIAKSFAGKIEKSTEDRGYLLWPLRLALSGKKASAGPFEIAEILGKEKTIKRLKQARKIIK